MDSTSGGAMGEYISQQMYPGVDRKFRGLKPNRTKTYAKYVFKVNNCILQSID